MQIFNEFNSRKPDELNVFEGVTNNHLFMGIVGSTLVLQVIHVAAFSARHLFIFLLGQIYLYSLNTRYAGYHHRISREVHFDSEA